MGLRGGIAQFLLTTLIALLLVNQPCTQVTEGQDSAQALAPASSESPSYGFMDDFNDTTNVTLDGDAIYENGSLTLRLPCFLSDDFERSTVTPWTVDQGKASISSGRLWLDSTVSDTVVSHNIDVENLRMEGRVMVTSLLNGGPEIRLVGDSGYTSYRCDAGGITISSDNGDGVALSIESDQWYTFSVERWHCDLRMRFGDAVVSGFSWTALSIANITSIELRYAKGESCFFDDFVVEELKDVRGAAISRPIQLPNDSIWSALGLWCTDSLEEEAYVRDICTIDLLDPLTLDVLPRCHDIYPPSGQGRPRYDPMVIDITDVDCQRHPSIQIRVTMRTHGLLNPVVSCWAVYWETTQGIWMDSFEDSANVSLTDRCLIDDGQVHPESLVWSDGFERLDISPWVAQEVASTGLLDIIDEGLCFSGGELDGERTVIAQAIDQRDVLLLMRFNSTATGYTGLNVTLVAGSGGMLCIGYEKATNRMFARAWDGVGWTNRSEDFTEAMRWTGIFVGVKRGGGFILGLITETERVHLLQGSMPDLRSNFTRLALVWCKGDSGKIECIELHRVYNGACIVSREVSLPPSMAWKSARTSHDDGVLLDILDGRTGCPVPGFTNVSSPCIDLSGIDPARHPTVRLRAWVVWTRFYHNDESPRIDWWQLLWTDDSYVLLETFDDSSNVTFHDGIGVLDGQLMTRSILLYDGFDRLDVEPWTIGSGQAEIWEGILWTDSGTVERILPPSKDLDLSLMFKMRSIGSYTPLSISLSDLSSDGCTLLYLYYDDIHKELVMTYDDGSNNLQYALDHFTAENGTWYCVNMVMSENHATVNIGNVKLDLDVPMSSPDTLKLSAGEGSEILWDEVLAVQSHLEGIALTSPINIPGHGCLLGLRLSCHTMRGAAMNISLVDGTTLEAIEGFERLGTHEVELLGVDPIDHPAIRIRFEMVGHLDSYPSVDLYGLFWAHPVGEVVQIKDIETILMEEDEPREDVSVLRDHFVARNVASEDLSFSILNISEPSKVLPCIRGGNLSIDLPTANWYGNASFRVACSYGDSRVETMDIQVMVMSVDDPPLIADPGILRAAEDQDMVIHLGDFISDVDTPANGLIVTTSDANCSSVGLDLRLHYTLGGFVTGLLLCVSDGSTEVHRVIMIDVMEVNDAPFISDVPPFHIDEDDRAILDLRRYVTDEETEPGRLLLGCRDEGVTKVTGLTIELLFTTGGERQLHFLVSDGTASTSGIIRVIVEEINDAPVIMGLGDLGLSSVMTIPEGTELALQARVIDEEADLLTYSIESAWSGVIVTSEGVVHIRSGNGRLGEWHATLIVEDAKGARSSQEYLIRVELVNDPPDVPLITLPVNHSVWYVGDAIDFKVAVFDRDLISGQPLWVAWTSDISGELIESTINSTMEFSWGNLPPGTHRITVTVTDREFERSAWIELTVLVPQEPSRDDRGRFQVAGEDVLALFIICGATGITGTIYLLRKRFRRLRLK